MKRLILMIPFLIAGCAQTEKETSVEPHPVIEARYVAFNAKNMIAMAKFEHPDIEVISHYDSKITSEIFGRENLAKIREGYFSAAPTAKATLHGWSYDGDYISLNETLITPINDTELIDVSTVVYQLEDNLIRRIWYYSPASN